MSIFRLQEHVPDVYPRKSRDFQLLCNIFDCMNGGVKFDIDSIRDTTNTDLCNERVLNFLQTKLGFFTNQNMNTTTQRLILKAFPYLVKNKGSRKGIEQAIQVFLKTQGVTGNISVHTINKQKVLHSTGLNKLENVYIIELGIQTKLLDTMILDEILKYIIPAGYVVKYSFYQSYNVDTEIFNSDTINIIFVQQSVNSGVRLTGETDSAPINAISLTTIPKTDIPEADKFEYDMIKGDGENV